jgi:hypothetical protein
VYQAAGKIGYSAELDGDDAVEIQDSASLDITSQVTVSAWIRPTTIGLWDRIVAKSHTVDVQPHTMYGLLFDDTSHLREEIASGSVQNGANGTSTVPTDGSWTYATVTYDHTVLRVYFNGVSQGTPTSLTTNIDTNDMPLSIGRSGYDSNYSTGRIDEVRVSNIARDECWIETEYKNQSAPETYIDVGAEVVVSDLSLANHMAGQETDKFTSASSVTGEELFAFKLTNNIGSGVTVDQIQFQLSGVSGVLQTDFANLAIYIDTNGDGTISGESTTVGGAGAVNIGVTTITFTSDFTISAGATVNYILKGDVSNLVAGDTVTIALGTSNVTLTSGTVGGSAPTNVTHTADSASGLTQIHYRWRNDDDGEGVLDTGTGADGSATISALRNINTNVIGSNRSTNADGILTTVTANPTGTSITVASTTGFATGMRFFLSTCK